MSKIPLLLFVLTACIAAVLVLCLLRSEPAAGHGVPHPEFSEMNQGGDAQRHANLILLGGLYGALQIVLLVTGLCLGIRRDRSHLGPLIIGGVAYVVVFAAMVASYARGMAEAAIVFGFPLPTFLMVFGMWGVPVVFVLLYIVKFKDWVFDEADALRFKELLKPTAPEAPHEEAV